MRKQTCNKCGAWILEGAFVRHGNCSRDYLVQKAAYVRHVCKSVCSGGDGTNVSVATTTKLNP
jgi:hypothetical protein